VRLSSKLYQQHVRIAAVAAAAAVVAAAAVDLRDLWQHHLMFGAGHTLSGNSMPAGVLPFRTSLTCSYLKMSSKMLKKKKITKKIPTCSQCCSNCCKIARAPHKSGIYDCPSIISAGESRTGNKMLPVQQQQHAACGMQQQQQHVADVGVMHEDYHVICSRTRGRYRTAGSRLTTIHFFGCQLRLMVVVVVVVVVVLLLWQQHVARLVVVVYQWQLIGDAFDDVESSGLLTSSTLS